MSNKITPTRLTNIPSEKETDPWVEKYISQTLSAKIAVWQN